MPKKVLGERQTTGTVHYALPIGVELQAKETLLESEGSEDLDGGYEEALKRFNDGLTQHRKKGKSIKVTNWTDSNLFDHNGGGNWQESEVHWAEQPSESAAQSATIRSPLKVNGTNHYSTHIRNQQEECFQSHPKQQSTYCQSAVREQRGKQLIKVTGHQLAIEENPLRISPISKNISLLLRQGRFTAAALAAATAGTASTSSLLLSQNFSSTGDLSQLTPKRHDSMSRLYDVHLQKKRQTLLNTLTVLSYYPSRGGQVESTAMEDSTNSRRALPPYKYTELQRRRKVLHLTGMQFGSLLHKNDRKDIKLAQRAANLSSSSNSSLSPSAKENDGNAFNSEHCIKIQQQSQERYQDKEVSVMQKQMQFPITASPIKERQRVKKNFMVRMHKNLASNTDDSMLLAGRGTFQKLLPDDDNMARGTAMPSRHRSGMVNAVGEMNKIVTENASKSYYFSRQREVSQQRLMFKNIVASRERLPSVNGKSNPMFDDAAMQTAPEPGNALTLENITYRIEQHLKRERQKNPKKTYSNQFSDHNFLVKRIKTQY